MAWTVVDLGTATSTSGATCTLTLTKAIPPGAVIVVGVVEASTTVSAGLVSDSSGNSYSGGTIFLNNTAASGSLSMRDTPLSCIAVPIGGTITYTKITSGTDACMSALYFQGQVSTGNARDGSTSATGSSATPAIVVPVTSTANDLAIAVVGWNASSATFTQDGSGSYSSPPSPASAGADTAVAGAFLVKPSVGPQLYAPALSGTAAWAINVITYVPSIASGLTISPSLSLA